MVPPTCPAKKLRWTARGRTWSSPPCSVRTSSILLFASLSKCQHSGQTNSVQEGPNAGLPCSLQSIYKDKEYLNHTLGLTLSTPGLVIIVNQVLDCLDLLASCLQATPAARVHWHKLYVSNLPQSAQLIQYLGECPVYSCQSSCKLIKLSITMLAVVYNSFACMMITLSHVSRVGNMVTCVCSGLT